MNYFFWNYLYCIFLLLIILVRGLAKSSIIGFGGNCGFAFGENFGFGGNCRFIKLLSEGTTGGDGQ